MGKIEDIKRNWRECFGDSREYIEMYFGRVVSDDDILSIEDNGKTVSSLLLQHYDLSFHDSVIGMGYICGACTRRSARGHGYMTSLMESAFRRAAQRGEPVVTLIPANSWLYYFYERFQMGADAFVDVERYTSLHAFATRHEYHAAVNPGVEFYDAFADLERMRPCCVLHTREQFENILIDNTMDGGHFVVVTGPDSEAGVASMAWGVENDGIVTVKDVMGIDEDARTGALAALRNLYPDRPFKVLAPVDERRRMTRRGMARIVDVEGVLKAIAASHPSWRCRIRVSDPLLEFNNGIWRIGGGEAVALPEGSESRHLDFDVDIETLTAMTFSSHRIASVLNFPATRLHLSLLMD